MSDIQPTHNPVVFYPPSQDPNKRMPGDFRPLPPQPEPAKEDADESDPKDLSAQESAPSSPGEVSQSNAQSALVPPAMIANAEKVNTKPKESEPSTPTS